MKNVVICSERKCNFLHGFNELDRFGSTYIIYPSTIALMKRFWRLPQRKIRRFLAPLRYEILFSRFCCVRLFARQMAVSRHNWNPFGSLNRTFALFLRAFQNRNRRFSSLGSWGGFLVQRLTVWRTGWGCYRRSGAHIEVFHKDATGQWTWRWTRTSGTVLIPFAHNPPARRN